MLNTIMGTWPNSWFSTLQILRMFHEIAHVTLSHPVWLLGGDPAACWSKNHFIIMSKGWQIMELDRAGAIRRHTADKMGTGTDGWWDRDSLISYFHTKYTESIAANQPPASHTWLGAWNASSYAASIAALPHPHSFGPIFLLCARYSITDSLLSAPM